MKAIKFTIIIAILGLFIVSCDSKSYQEISGVVTNPTYEANVKSIINTNCVSCHSDAGNQTNPYLDTYDGLKAACLPTYVGNGNGNVLCRIDASCGTIMPQAGSMPAGSINLIKLWAQQGYIQQ